MLLRPKLSETKIIAHTLTLILIHKRSEAWAHSRAKQTYRGRRLDIDSVFSFTFVLISTMCAFKSF